MKTLISIMIMCCFSFLVKAQDSCLAKVYKFYDLDIKMLNDWNVDVNGCKKIRSRYARDLEKNDKILGMPKDLFLNIFGKADSVTNQQIYIYGVNSDCDANQKRFPNSTLADLVVVFFNDKLVSVSMAIID